jgi:signal transduction histidine kinase
MRRRAKPARPNVTAKLPSVRRSPRNERSSVRDLEARLAEALEQQASTAEILRVIASSPTDLQSVLDSVAESAARLCEATDVLIHRVDGQMLPIAASVGSFAATYSPDEKFPITRGSVVGRAVMERKTIHIHDLATESREEFPVAMEFQGRHGHRTVLTTPLMRAGTPLGAIWMRRTEVRPFTDKQIKLLETFADQAVIAIENARLFKELQTRNHELAVSLAQRTATSEVLAVISGAPTDLQSVFDAIVRNARRLCDASYSSVYRVDAQLVHLIAHNHQRSAAAEVIRGAWPMPLTGDSFVTRAIRENALVHADPQDDRDASAALIARAKALGHRRVLVVPMAVEGEAVGAIRVSRSEATPFTEQHIALLKTFADQAVIAIENVRLFDELQARNRDVEEKSRQLEAASRHKSEFLANMSHELRTPLNAIIGFAEVLTEHMFGELNAKQDEYLKDIYASGQHLLSLINDILDLSKIEAGRMDLDLTDFDVPVTIGNALVLLRERAGQRGITLGCELDERVGVIRADERKVKQVLLNLLSNALKFTREAGRIDVRATLTEGLVEISVADTGVGIAPEDQEAVFEEFRQVGTADKKVEGTGLGLALSRKFVELHSGRIWVKSQVGVGSTFTFTLPVRRDE